MAGGAGAGDRVLVLLDSTVNISLTDPGWCPRTPVKFTEKREVTYGIDYE